MLHGIYEVSFLAYAGVLSAHRLFQGCFMSISWVLGAERRKEMKLLHNALLLVLWCIWLDRNVVCFFLLIIFFFFLSILFSKFSSSEFFGIGLPVT